MWLLVGGALAHTPHDVALYLAVDPETGRIATHMPRGERWYAMTSLDGLTWETWLSVDAPPAAGAFTEDGSWLLGTVERGLYISEDQGRTWKPSSIDEGTISALQVEGERVWAGGPELFVSLDAGQSFQSRGVFESGDVSAFDRDCLATTGGEVWCSADEGWSWELAASIEAPVIDLAVRGLELWVATEGHGVQHWDGSTWTQLTDSETFTIVQVMDGWLYAASADKALWRSEDGGETRSIDGTGIETPSGGLGSPPNGHHYHDLDKTPTGLVLASWEGLFRSKDGGDTWFQLPIVHPQTFWNTDLYLGSEGDLRVVLPGYGGTGLSWVSETGQRGTMGQNQACCPRTAEFSESFSTDGQGWISERGNAWVTQDGQSWGDVTELSGLDYIETIVVGRGEDPSALALGVPADGNDMTTMLSEDAGDSYYELVAPIQLSPVLHGAGFDDQGRAWVVAGDDLAVMRQVGLSLELMSYAPRRIQPLVVDGDQLWAPSVNGLLAGDTSTGKLLLHSLDGAHVADVLPLEDRLLASLPDAVVQSTDQGETWTTLWEPPSTVTDLEALGDWLVASTPQGVWASQDNGESWILASNSYRMYTRQQQWRFGPEWELTGRQDAYNMTVSTALEVDATGRLDVDAESLALLAVVGPERGELSVRVDGDDWRTISLEADEERIATIWCEDFERDWHVLELKVEALPVELDAVEVRVGEGMAGPLCSEGPLDSADTGHTGDTGGEDTDRCGRCATGPSTGPWLLALALALYWSRARSSASASEAGKRDRASS